MSQVTTPTPSEPAATPPPSPHLPSRWRVVFQVIAFAAGLAILGLFIHKAASPENREKLNTLWQAPPRDIAALIALSLTSLALNGAIFWITIRPVRRLRFIDVLATNAGATFLAYMPMKLSAISRFIIHNRRDKVPVFTIAAWMGAVGITLAASLCPPIGAAVWRQRIDPLFVATTAAGLALAYALTLYIARHFAGPQGLARLHRLTDPLKIKLLDRGMRSTFFHNFHAGFDMLAHPGALALAMLMRTGDVLVQAVRFALAAKVVGVHLGWENAILVATTYFIVGVISPAGTLGTREGGATAFAALLPSLPTNGFIVVALVVGAAEFVTNTACGLAGLIYLRPDKLLRGPSPHPTSDIPHPT